VSTDRGRSYTAFEGRALLASGTLEEVSLPAARANARGREAVLVFDDTTGRPVDLDFRGGDEEIRSRARHLAATLEPDAGTGRRGPGRPRLGVVGKEVTLLPRHWAWLAAQPGGASATLRRLVERARKEREGRDQVRRARDAAYRFISAMAGDLPGYEEALRALYRGNRSAFREEIAGWPTDVVAHACRLTAEAFDDGGPVESPRNGDGERTE
jgi:hypothetical protein